MTDASAAAAAASAAAAAAAAGTAAVTAAAPALGRVGGGIPRSTPDLIRPRASVRPPPTEALAKAYFGPLLAPTPVATRVPEPSKTADTINGFLRVEAGGGTLRGEMLLWDVAVILHAYANNTEEYLAEQLINDALTWGSNASGYTQAMPNGDEWYITYSRCTANATRKADPYVNMTRYRAMVTWRIPGLPPLPVGARARRVVAPPSGPSPRTAVPGAPKPTRRR
jgi:hypothetical protein